MTTLEEILSRARLVPGRAVPRDTVPPRDTGSRTRPKITPGETPNMTAAEDLRALCETVVRHTPATDVADFVTDQIPEPRSALVLACVLQLADTDDGARFWWQYAAGAGQPTAAYCLYLHHLALGETHVASWWYTQTDEVEPANPTGRGARLRTGIRWEDPRMPTVLHDASTTTLLRVLRLLARNVARPRSAVVAELMTFIPIAVAVGYLHEPDSELPLPGSGFARQIRARLAAAAERPDSPSDLPARPKLQKEEDDQPQRQRNCQVDEAATH